MRAIDRKLLRDLGRLKGQAVTIALESERNWARPVGQRREIVPGASHFMAHAIASPSWRNAYQVATIGDHTFLQVQKLKSRRSRG